GFFPTSASPPSSSGSAVLSTWSRASRRWGWPSVWTSAPGWARSSRHSGGSAKRADQGAAADDEHRSRKHSAGDRLVADEQRRERHAPQRLGRDERGDDADAAAVVRLEERHAREAEADARRREGAE